MNIAQLFYWSFLFFTLSINRCVLLVQTESFLLLYRFISFTFIFGNTHLLHFILLHYLFGYSISIFSVYCCLGFFFVFCTFFVLLFFSLLFIRSNNTSNNNIWNFDIVKSLFLVLSTLDSFYLIVEEEGNIYFILHSNFFTSSYFL